MVLLFAVVALLAVVVFQLAAFFALPPIGVILGQESKDSFLEKRLGNYRALQFLQENLPRHARVMMMWDGQGYYCDERCLPDADQSNWTRLIGPASDPHGVAARLQANGVTHLLLDQVNLKIISGLDPSGRTERAAEFFQEVFLPACGEEIYRDRDMLLVKVDCGR